MVRLVVLRLLECYFRHRFLYLLPIVLMLGAAGAFITLSDHKYTAAGSLYVQQESLVSTLSDLPGDGFSWTTPAELTVSEINELLQTEAFLRAAIQDTKLEPFISGDQETAFRTFIFVRESVWVTSGGDNLVKFGATDNDPETAFQLANSLFETYISWKLNSNQQDSSVAQSFFADQLEPYQAELTQARADLDAYLESHPQPVRGDRPLQEEIEITRLQGEVAAATTRVNSLVDKEENARLAQTQAESDVRQTYMMIDAPQLPITAQASLRDIVQDIALFLFAGVFLTVAGIVIGALLDRTYRFPLDVRQSLNLPVLAMTPYVPSRRPLAELEPAPADAAADTDATDAAINGVPVVALADVDADATDAAIDAVPVVALADVDAESIADDTVDNTVDDGVMAPDTQVPSVAHNEPIAHANGIHSIETVEPADEEGSKPVGVGVETTPTSKHSFSKYARRKVNEPQ